MVKHTSLLVVAAALYSLSACKKDDATPAPPAPSAAPSTATSASLVAPVEPDASKPAALAFEGDVILHVIEGKRPPVDIEVLVKGGKVRMDYAGHNGPVRALYDSVTRLLTVVATAQKTATTTTVPSAEPEVASIKKTGTLENLFGRDCEDWEVTVADGRHESLCVADGLDLFDLNAATPADSPLPSFGSWIGGLATKKQFPLSALVSGPTGAIEGRMQLTRIEPHPVDESAFAMPDGAKPAK